MDSLGLVVPFVTYATGARRTHLMRIDLRSTTGRNLMPGKRLQLQR